MRVEKREGRVEKSASRERDSRGVRVEGSARREGVRVEKERVEKECE